MTNLFRPFILTVTFSLSSVSVQAQPYSVGELKQYAEFYAGISENQGPDLELTAADREIVEEYKAFVEDFQAKMAEYNTFSRRDRDAKREFVKRHFNLDQVDFPTLDEVGKFVNFYWNHKKFGQARENDGSPRKVDISQPRESAGPASPRGKLTVEEYKAYLDAQKGPKWHKYYGMTPEEYVKYLREGFEAKKNTPCHAPAFKTDNREHCDVCWYAFQKKLLIYDMEDWNSKKRVLRQDPDLKKKTGRDYEQWKQCALYLNELESQGHL